MPSHVLQNAVRAKTSLRDAYRSMYPLERGLEELHVEVPLLAGKFDINRFVAEEFQDRKESSLFATVFGNPDLEDHEIGLLVRPPNVQYHNDTGKYISNIKMMLRPTHLAHSLSVFFVPLVRRRPTRR